VVRCRSAGRGAGRYKPPHGGRWAPEVTTLNRLPIGPLPGRCRGQVALAHRGRRFGKRLSTWVKNSHQADCPGPSRNEAVAGPAFRRGAPQRVGVRSPPWPRGPDLDLLLVGGKPSRAARKRGAACERHRPRHSREDQAWARPVGLDGFLTPAPGWSAVPRSRPGPFLESFRLEGPARPRKLLAYRNIRLVARDRRLEQGRDLRPGPPPWTGVGGRDLSGGTSGELPTALDRQTAKQGPVLDLTSRTSPGKTPAGRGRTRRDREQLRYGSNLFG